MGERRLRGQFVGMPMLLLLMLVRDSWDVVFEFGWGRVLLFFSFSCAVVVDVDGGVVGVFSDFGGADSGAV